MPKRTTSRLQSPTAAETLLGQRSSSGSVLKAVCKRKHLSTGQGRKKSSRYGHKAVGKNGDTFMAKHQELPLLPVEDTA